MYTIIYSVEENLSLTKMTFLLHLKHKFQGAVSTGSTERVNGPFRDVVNTGMSGDNVTFLFRTDNPGPWLVLQAIPVCLFE